MNFARRITFSVCWFGFAVASVASARASEKRVGSFDSNGVRIRYEVQGRGEPVVLVHGFLATALVNWGFPGIVRDLARDYQVITYDQRGHGKSDKPENPEAYGLEMVNDLVGLMDHLSVKRAHVVGYSMGGMIVIKAIVDHPERFRSAVVGGMGWVRANDGSARRGRYSPERFPTRAHWACFEEFYRFGITRSELASLSTPTTLVLGQNDLFIRIAGVDPLRRVRPDIPLFVVEGGNHIECVTRPDFKIFIRKALEAHAEPPGE